MSQSKKNKIRLHSSLTKGCTDTRKEYIEDSFQAARSFVEALADCLEGKIEEKIKASEHLSNYEKQEWALYQADNAGYRRALRDILNLFIDNRKQND